MTSTIHLYRGLARAAAYRGWIWSRLARKSSGADAEACRESARNAFRAARIICGEHVQPKIGGAQ